MRRLADGGEGVVGVPVVLDRVQVQVAVAGVAVDVGDVTLPHSVQQDFNNTIFRILARLNCLWGLFPQPCCTKYHHF